MTGVPVVSPCRVCGGRDVIWTTLGRRWGGVLIDKASPSGMQITHDCRIGNVGVRTVTCSAPTTQAVLEIWNRWS